MIRLSPDTAIRVAAGEAQSLVGLVEQASVQLGSAAGQSLARDLRALAAADHRRQLRIDVARPATLTDDQRARLAAALGASDAAQLELPDRWTRAEGGGELRVFSFEQPPLTPVGQLAPMYLAIALPADWAAQAVLEELEELAMHRAKVLLVPLDGQPVAELRDLGRRLQRQAWTLDVRDPADPAMRPWREDLLSPEWQPGHEIAQAYAMARACLQAGEAFELLLRRESDALRVRRALVEQRVQQTRGKSSAVRPQDVAREVEGLVKQELGEFARRVGERLAAWAAPQTGELGAEMNREIAALDELDEQPLGNRLVLSLRADDERRILDLLHGRLLEHARRNLMALAETQQALKERIAQRLAAAGLPEVPLSFGVPAFDRFERHLNNRLVFDAPYRAETRKHGMPELLMAARRYSMPLTMIGMPLLIFLKLEKEYQQEVLWLGAVLLFGGLFLVWRRAPTERAQERARELEKARQSVQREVRRMITDAEREWTTLLGEHLRDQPAAVRAELETTLDAHVRRNAESTEQEHARVERQMHGLQNTERQIGDAEKQRSAGTRTFEQLRDRLQQLFGDMQRDAARRPAAPPPATRA